MWKRKLEAEAAGANAPLAAQMWAPF